MGGATCVFGKLALSSKKFPIYPIYKKPQNLTVQPTYHYDDEFDTPENCEKQRDKPWFPTKNPTNKVSERSQKTAPSWPCFKLWLLTVQNGWKGFLVDGWTNPSETII